MCKRPLKLKPSTSYAEADLELSVDRVHVEEGIVRASVAIPVDADGARDSWKG
jgi:hypothetical protein